MCLYEYLIYIMQQTHNEWLFVRYGCFFILQN